MKNKLSVLCENTAHSAQGFSVKLHLFKETVSRGLRQKILRYSCFSSYTVVFMIILDVICGRNFNTDSQHRKQYQSKAW
jgi:hypothetical protein